jgi:hypothetical protein
MAVDIFQMLVDIFRISPSMVSQYASATPLEQWFYLFFFPTLFIIILIYILVSHWMSEHRGLSILLAIAVYAFIIFQGFYSWFVFLSPYWLILLLVLGGIWLFFRPRGGGGASGMTSGKKGKGGKLLGFLEDVTGKKFNPAQIAKLHKMIERDMKRLLERKKTLEKRASELKHDPQAANFVYNQIGQIDQALAILKNFKQSGELADYEDWRKTNSHLLGL